MLVWETVILYLIYGTSFIVMFLFITKERKRTAHIELMESFRYLAVFGLIHGLAEYFAIPSILAWQTTWIFDIVKLILVSISFTALLAFGLNIITVEFDTRRWWIRGLPYGALLMYIWLLIFVVFTNYIDYNAFYKVADLMARYSLGFIGAGVSSYAFLHLSEKMKILAVKEAEETFFTTGLGFGLYAIFGGLIVDTVIGVPVIIFRTAIALIITTSVINVLKSFRVR